VAPYSRKLTRALRKERKIYLYDWGDISSPGARLENLVALHLWKAVQTWTALGETRAELYYLRDKEKRETDFLLVADRRPVLLIECKTAETQLSPDLLHYQQLLNVPLAIQLVSEKGCDLEWKRHGKTQRLLSADRWLAALP
jgi:predicted AAA+ superfamily ATPase